MGDMIVLIPGIMGSELKRGDDVLWGLQPGLWIKQTIPFVNPLGGLAVTEERLRGKPDGIEATDLLRFPVALPRFTSIEPYNDLEHQCRQLAGHPDALGHPGAYLPFPYDWRLSIADAARQLETTLDQHLTAWKANAASGDDPKVNLICHSMGGLVGRYFVEVLGARDIVRHFITLGTPFAGALKALRILETGEAIKARRFHLFKKRVRDAARTMPGLHELGPHYDCVETHDSDGGTVLRPLTTAERVALGATGHLVEPAEATFRDLNQSVVANGPFDRLRSIVGTTQPTYTSLAIADGEATYKTTTPTTSSDTDQGGDGTVPVVSASTRSSTPGYLPQRHGALAKTRESITAIEAILNEDELGRPLGDDLGMDLPDLVQAAESFDVVAITDSDSRPTCSIYNADTGRLVRTYPTKPTGDHVKAQIAISDPGLYRIQLHGGGYSPVSELIWVFPPTKTNRL